MLVFGDYPSTMIEVVNVPLYKGFSHIVGLLLIVIWAIFFFCGMVDSFHVIGVFVCALYYPIPIYDLAHDLKKIVCSKDE